MDELKQLDEAVKKAVAKFREEYGEEAVLEDGDDFVTIFNNAVLILSREGNTLHTKFIGGKPCRVHMTLKIYEKED